MTAESRVRRPLRALLLWVLAAVGLALAAGVAAGAWISRTAEGREFALEWAVSRLRPMINGSITVGSLGPPGLLEAATLYELAVTDTTGHTVIAADSIKAQYSILGLLTGTPDVTDLEIWGAVLDLAAEHGPVDLAALVALPDEDAPDQDAPNQAAPNQAAPDAMPAVSSPAIRIGDIAIRSATVVRPGELAGENRVITIDADLWDVAIRPAERLLLTANARAPNISYPVGNGVLQLSDIVATIAVGAETTVVEFAQFDLPESRGRGRLETRPQPDGRRTFMDLDMSHLALTDLRWIHGGLDGGVAQGRFGIVYDPTGLRIDLDEVRADLDDGGRLALSGALLVDDATTLSELRLSPDGLATREIEPFVPVDQLPTGRISGELSLDGALDRLDFAGDLTLQPEPGRGPPMHVVGNGTIPNATGVADLELTVASLNYALLQPFVVQPGVRGIGDLAIRANGRLETGIAVEIAATHALPGDIASQVALAGSLYGDTAISVVDLDGTVSPLSLPTLGAFLESTPLHGQVDGSFSLRGPMERLDMAVDLHTESGRLAAEGTINARNPAAGYAVAVSSDDLDLSRLLPMLPESTTVAGRATLVGQGLDLGSLQANLTLDTGPSSIGALHVDSAAFNGRVDGDGLLHVETLYAEAAGVVVDGQGDIGAMPGVVGGGIEVSLSSPSIRPLRDLFMGPNLVAWDELSRIEQDLLIELDGVDPDTVPRARDLRFGGAVQGDLEIYGGLDDLSAAGVVRLNGLEYGQTAAASLVAELDLAGMRIARDQAGTPDNPGDSRFGDPRVRITATGDSLAYGERRYQRATAEIDFALGAQGRLRALVERSDRESYEAQGVVRLTDRTGRVDLDRLTLVFDDRRWNLQGPARFQWSPDFIEVNDFGLIRPGGQGLSLRANGRIARNGGGESDFRLGTNALELSIVGRLLQMETPPTGRLAMDLRANGTGTDPRWQGVMRIDEAEYQTLLFDSLTVRGSYAARSLTTALESWTNGRRALAINGTVPLDFTRAPVDEPLPERPIGLTVAADSFPAAMASGALKSLEQIDGTVSGNVALTGNTSEPQLNGALHWQDGAALIASVGVQLSSAEVNLGLNPDGSVNVTASAVSGGTIDVDGTVDVSQLADSVPLNLAFRARNFRVIEREDMEAAISSDNVTLTGSFDFPFIQGAVDVEGGTVFVEEFQRTAEAVNLYDPALFRAATLQFGDDRDDDVVETRLPFLQNLRMLIDVHVGRGNFLRSRQMNVETTGDLRLTFDRRGNQLILAGEMGVARGTYSLGPRTLTLTEGVFRFPGTPGFNPGIAITAEDRLRTRDGQPLVITADISGTLLSPVPTFSSDSESAMSEADLINYLVFGRSTSALLGEAGAPVGAARDLLLGQFANEISYLLATDLGVDHISVSRSEQGQANAAFGASSLQLEVGKYVLDDLYLTGVFERGFCTDPTLPRNSGGVRFEVGMPRDVRLEGFVEGRCTRGGYRGLGDAALELENIWGFLLFREWGY